MHGADTVNPAGTGTKAALHYVLDVPAGGSADDPGAAGATDAPTARSRRRLRRAWWRPGPAEADAYFADLMPAGTTDDEAAVVRAAIAGLMWGKQYYHFDVDRWLTGDAGPTPPAGHRNGRNSAWWHMHAADVISMPDPWEYPWFAAWDLAFHCVAIARVDPAFAKEQLLLLLRDWYLHPDGQIPAYEWAFGDVNPPVHAWAALRVFEIDGGRDLDFLARIMHKLLLNFTWWVNRKDNDGNNVFEGGFLGLDNVGPFDRSAALPVAGELEQSDGTGWMAHVRAEHAGDRACCWPGTTTRTRTSRRSSSSTSPTSAAAAKHLWSDRRRVLLRRAAAGRRRRSRCGCSRSSASSRCARPRA